MRSLFISLTVLLSCQAVAQQEQQTLTLSGNVQSDWLIPQNDEKIGTEKKEDVLTNTYVSLFLQSQHIDAGLRMEYLEHPLPGYEQDFKGWGVPYFFMKLKLKNFQLTAGTFYEQFGSGFILRTYEDRFMGVDNSLLGARVVTKPFNGITIKALAGKQRRYWKWNPSLISGMDVELNLDELIPSIQRKDIRLMLGASWVNKYENVKEEVFADPTHKVNIPHNVNEWDVRANLNCGSWNLLLEYAQKTEDPSYTNGYIFHKGTAVMLSSSYSKKGLSVLLQAKRSENMSFKSTANTTKAVGISSAINHLPPFTQEHTYALAALYPYATQLADGEWAYQAELGYKFKKGTALGGRYGTNLKLNYSYVRSIQRDFIDGNDYTSLTGVLALAGTNGYCSSFFKWGDQTYYRDINVQLSKKLSRSFKLHLMWMNQLYNQNVIEGHGSMIHSNIFIFDGKFQLSSKITLRGEVQYLATKDDRGDWAYGLLELSLAPHWMATICDLYNVGESHIHYYQGFITFNTGAHRLQAGYGRTRAGYNCSGGICRWIPASRGFSLSYNYNF